MFSLVANAGTVDGRVMKQAATLRDSGYDVWLYGLLVPGSAESEQAHGINVRRIPYFDSKKVSSRIKATALSVFGRNQDLIDQTDKALREANARKQELANWLNEKRERVYYEAANKATGHFLKKKYKSKKQELKNLVAELEAAKGSVFYYRYYQFAENLISHRFETLPDIIHAHDLMALPGAVALSKLTGAKVIFDAHEIETERTPPLPADRKQFIKELEEDLFQHIDEMVVCCDSAADFYFDIFKKKRPILVMNAPDNRFLTNTAPPGHDIRSQSGLSAETPLIVYTGAVGLEARGVDKIVQSLRYLPGYHLAIQGPRKDKFDSWLRAIAEEEGCLDRVHFLQSVPQDILVDTLRTGDVGVCAFQDVSLNHRYALPNKLFEMAFADLPLCLSNLVEMSKFIQRVGNGVCMDETNPSAIAEAIRHVYENRQRYTLSPSGKEALSREYSWATQARRLQEMYAKLGRPIAFPKLMA
ncbi:glycosyltransferase [Microvirga sp. G4-2]|uniref:glycosyltransferase n=1 Tax=Microvirga sp. G4-2 TaxID=3434467 RepID=UPI004044AB03